MSEEKTVKAFSPGEYLVDKLNQLKWTKYQLAEICGIGIHVIDGIIDGSRVIDDKISQKFAKAFGNSARYWISLEQTYNLWKQEKEVNENEGVPNRIVFVKFRGFSVTANADSQNNYNCSLIHKETGICATVNESGISLSFKIPGTTIMLNSGTISNFNPRFDQLMLDMVESVIRITKGGPVRKS